MKWFTNFNYHKGVMVDLVKLDDNIYKYYNHDDLIFFDKIEKAYLYSPDKKYKTNEKIVEMAPDFYCLDFLYQIKDALYEKLNNELVFVDYVNSSKLLKYIYHSHQFTLHKVGQKEKSYLIDVKGVNWFKTRSKLKYIEGEDYLFLKFFEKYNASKSTKWCLLDEKIREVCDHFNPMKNLVFSDYTDYNKRWYMLYKMDKIDESTYKLIYEYKFDSYNLTKEDIKRKIKMFFRDKKMERILKSNI